MQGRGTWRVACGPGVVGFGRGEHSADAGELIVPRAVAKGPEVAFDLCVYLPCSQIQVRSNACQSLLSSPGCIWLLAVLVSELGGAVCGMLQLCTEARGGRQHDLGQADQNNTFPYCMYACTKLSIFTPLSCELS